MLAVMRLPFLDLQCSLGTRPRRAWLLVRPLVTLVRPIVIALCGPFRALHAARLQASSTRHSHCTAARFKRRGGEEEVRDERLHPLARPHLQRCCVARA